jgi:hypothetical protein
MRTPPVRRVHRFLRAGASSLAVLALVGSAGCGSGGGGGGGGAGTGLVLVSFAQASIDNIALNQPLNFQFSDVLDVDSISPASIQIRKGPSFGAAVEGRYIVEGSRVTFEPRLPSTCDLAGSGYEPDTDYRVTLIGAPEEFAVRSSTGEFLEATLSFSFHTRDESDAGGLYEDQQPGLLPTVISHSPRDGAHPPVDAEVNIGPSNRVIIEFSENLDPCTVTQDTVTFTQRATGDTDEQPNGFNPDQDQTPGDPSTWGSGTPTSPPQRIRSTYVLQQTFLSTRLEIIPEFGEYPDNALLVVEVTTAVRDFGGNPMVPTTFSFVTENRSRQCTSRTLRFDGDVGIDESVTTADVDTTRAPDRVQGFMLFAGDGDNGEVLNIPSGPACEGYEQPNDGSPDDFDTATGDVTLDTGASPNTECTNLTDGSNAVVFEYRTFRIRNARTVTIVGANPAIILVSGDVVIEAGGRLFARGGAGVSGTGGYQYPNGPGQAQGGPSTAGGGRGGATEVSDAYPSEPLGAQYGFNGAPGFGSDDYLLTPGTGGTGSGLQGSGHGNVSAVNSSTTTASPNNVNAPGGGGGGHATAGGTGIVSSSAATSPAYMEGPPDGAGGGTYGELSGKMPTLEAGAGGGAGGKARAYVYNNTTYYSYYDGGGGAGGGGGGGVDLTAGGDIRIFGTVDVSGGRGGSGGNGGSTFQGGGGGGGGSGGGLRLLTPNSIEFGVTTLITAAGGGGGSGGSGMPTGAPPNGGGSGGVGRLVFEDADSVITGFAGATVIPNEGSPAGFYRGVFDPSRFQGGGLTPQATTLVMDVGPTFPKYEEPTQDYGGVQDFIAGIPAVSSRGVGATSIFIEAQGFPVRPDGTPNLTSPSGWKHVGYFTDSGAETFPTWSAGTPLDVDLPPDGTPGGLSSLNDMEFVQFRITFFLKPGVGPFDRGPYIDDWTLRFCYDQ